MSKCSSCPYRAVYTELLKWVAQQVVNAEDEEKTVGVAMNIYSIATHLFTAQGDFEEAWEITKNSLNFPNPKNPDSFYRLKDKIEQLNQRLIEQN